MLSNYNVTRELPKNALLAGALIFLYEASPQDMTKLFDLTRNNYHFLNKNYDIIIFPNYPLQSNSDSYDQSFFGYDQNCKYFALRREHLTRYLSEIFFQISDRDLLRAFEKAISDFKNNDILS